MKQSTSEAELAASDAAGFVLAGGRSSRMGRDKATIQFHGKPLIVHALRILREAGLSASIAGARSPLDEFAPVVQDGEPDRGPLGGICAALASSRSRYGVFISVDTPLFPPSLLSLLMDTVRDSGAAAVMTSLGGFVQTFPVALNRALLPYLRKELEAGRGGCFSAFESSAACLGLELLVLPAESIVLQGATDESSRRKAENWFVNLNSPADVDRAESMSPDGIT